MSITLTEKKDHIINAMPNLSTEEKAQLIKYFNLHPNDESKIDWNKSNALTYQDFQSVINRVSKSARKKTIKNTGIKGLTDGEDYVTVFTYEYVQSGGRVAGTIVGYAPLHWEASKVIASKYIGDTEVTGEWCVAYSKDNQYWNKYCGDEDSFFVYFVDYNPESQWGKVAVRVYPNVRYEVWNAEDHLIYDSAHPSTYTDEEYPKFLFDSDKMKGILQKAHALVSDAGGVQAEATKEYSISISFYGEINSDRVLEGSVAFQQLAYSSESYDIEDDGDETTSSKFSIYKVGRDSEYEDSPIGDDFQQFNIWNGTGLYIKYDNDYTPDQAQTAANRKWEGEVDDQVDDYDMKRELKALTNNTMMDYLIFSSDSALDDYLSGAIDDTVFIFSVRDEGSYMFSKVFSILEDEDSAGNSYTIMYSNDYNFSSKAKDDWASLPGQRKRDRQLDLPYGL
jgi:hypothetical protein